MLPTDPNFRDEVSLCCPGRLQCWAPAFLSSQAFPRSWHHSTWFMFILEKHKHKTKHRCGKTLFLLLFNGVFLLVFLIAFLLVFLFAIHHYVTLEYIHIKGNVDAFLPLPSGWFSWHYWTISFSTNVLFSSTLLTTHHIHSHCLFLLIVLLFKELN